MGYMSVICDKYVYRFISVTLVDYCTPQNYFIIFMKYFMKLFNNYALRKDQWTIITPHICFDVQ